MIFVAHTTQDTYITYKECPQSNKKTVPGKTDGGTATKHHTGRDPPHVTGLVPDTGYGSGLDQKVTARLRGTGHPAPTGVRRSGSAAWHIAHLRREDER